MKTHTLGPWRVVEREVLEDGGVYPRHIVGIADIPVCFLESPVVARLAHENANSVWAEICRTADRNSGLITAAPKLLAALQSLMTDFGGTTSYASASPEATQARAAIAEATGGAA